MTETVQVADPITPVVGWRAWRVTPAGLASVNHPWLWVPKETSTAQCLINGARAMLLLKYGAPDQVPHSAPLEGCTCGFYTARERWRLSGYPLDVIGRVAMWGKVIEYDGGWRAEKAYPQAFFVTPEKREELRPVLERYGVPILSTYDLPAEALPKCSVCSEEIAGEVYYGPAQKVTCQRCAEAERQKAYEGYFSLLGQITITAAPAFPTRRKDYSGFVANTFVGGVVTFVATIWASAVAIGSLPWWTIITIVVAIPAAASVFQIALDDVRP